MNKQFWYSDTTQHPDKVVEASFNVDMVIRTLVMEDDTLVLVLSDGHTVEEIIFERYPKGHKKEGEVRFNTQNKPIILFTTRDWVQSKVRLTLPEDIKRFKEVTEVTFYPHTASKSKVFETETAKIN